MKNPHTTLLILAVLVGIAFVALGFFYAVTPAGNLPAFFPGFEIASTHIHVKHALAAFVLGIGSFVWAWFRSGKKS